LKTPAADEDDDKDEDGLSMLALKPWHLLRMRGLL
jgi:hypothetical protein